VTRLRADRIVLDRSFFERIGGSMFDQLFESFRKASESSLQAQQEMFKQWWQHSAPLLGANGVTDMGDVQKRWKEYATEKMEKQRVLLDSLYRSGIEVIEQAFRVTEAKTPEDYRRVMEELWRKLSENFKAQSEVQLREFQDATAKWLEKARVAKTPS
jgi:hypothetical protein